MESGVEVRRSRRRRRTVSARMEAGRIIIMIPATMSTAEEAHWVEVMTRRLTSRSGRRPASDAELARRAAELSDRYLGGLATPTSIRWVTNQSTRWGSCTPSAGTIRISHRVQAMPPWVRDYVILHELAHLLVAGHGAEFWSLLSGYDRLERARGFLEGAGLAEADGALGGSDRPDRHAAHDADEPGAGP